LNPTPIPGPDNGVWNAARTQEAGQASVRRRGGRNNRAYTQRGPSRQ
jgi:hypothetical protein